MKKETLEEKTNKQCWLHQSREKDSSITTYRTNNQGYIDKTLESSKIIPYKGKSLLVEKEGYVICSEKKGETEINFRERTNVLGYILLKYDSSYLLSSEEPILTKYLKSKLRKSGFETQKDILRNKSNLKNRKMVSVLNYGSF